MGPGKRGSGEGELAQVPSRETVSMGGKSPQLGGSQESRASMCRARLRAEHPISRAPAPLSLTFLEARKSPGGPAQGCEFPWAFQVWDPASSVCFLPLPSSLMEMGAGPRQTAWWLTDLSSFPRGDGHSVLHRPPHRLDAARQGSRCLHSEHSPHVCYHHSQVWAALGLGTCPPASCRLLPAHLAPSLSALPPAVLTLLLVSTVR